MRAGAPVTSRHPPPPDALDGAAGSLLDDGAEVPPYWLELDGRAVALFEEGRFGDAADVMEALVRETAVLGPSHPVHRERLEMLAHLLYRAGRYGPAHAAFADVVAQRRSGGVRDGYYAQLLVNFGDLCREQGDLERAESLVGEALKVYAAAEGARSFQYGAVLEKLGRIRMQSGDLPGAGRLLRRALRVLRACPGVPAIRLSACLGALGELHLHRGQLRAAHAMAEEALSVTRAAFGVRHPEAIVALANHGTLLLAMGDAARGETVLREVLALHREGVGATNPQTVSVFITLAQLLLDRSELGEAEALILKAVMACGPDAVSAGPRGREALKVLAHLRSLQGRDAEADALYGELVAAQDQDGPPDHPFLATLLLERAGLALARSDFALARTLYRRAEAIARRSLGVRHPTFAQAAFGVAAIHQALGDLRTALRLVRRTVAIERAALGPLHPSLAVSLGVQGWLHANLLEFDRAAEAWVEALEIHRANGNAEGVETADGWDALAVIQMELGDLESAERLHRRALRIKQDRLGVRHPAVGDSLHHLAVLRYRAGRFTESAVLGRRALRVLRAALGPAHTLVLRCMHTLAAVLARQGRHAAALRLTVHVEEAFDRTLHAVLAAGSEVQQMGFLDVLRTQRDIFLSLTLRASHGSRAAGDFVLRRKGITAELRTAQRVDARAHHGDVAARLEGLDALRLRIARKMLDGPGAEGPAAHRRILAAWEAERDTREAELAAHVPALSLEQRLRTADARAVAAALPAGAALVELTQYAPVDFDRTTVFGPERGAPRYLALVIRGDAPGRPAIVDLGPARHIDRLVARFRAASRRGMRELETGDASDGDDLDGAGHALRAAVLDPLARALGKRTRLFVAPDGELALLPWEALPLARGGYVIDRFHVSYLTTGRDLLRLAERSDGEHGAPVVVAAPDYELAETSAVGPDTARVARSRRAPAPGHPARALRGTAFPALDGAAAEGVRVGRMLGVPPLLGAEALEGRVREVRSPAVLHIATHGFFLASRPARRRSPAPAALSGGGAFARLERVESPLLRSGLALAGANRWLRGLPLPPGAEDGLLTAEDVATLDLHGTELVVLSACDTGVGRARVGEGVFGLRRAFVLAGARTLVLSLWSVPDAQTRALMEDFYRRLLAGEPRSEALREARMAMRNTHPEPWAWGAFICQGDPGPLPAPVLETIRGPGRFQG